MTADALSSVCYLGVLDSLSEASIAEILESWNSLCLVTEVIVIGDDADLSSSYSKFQSYVSRLCKHGLRSLMEEDEVELLLCKALEEISLEKQYQEKYLLMLVKSLQLCQESTSMEGHSSDVKKFLFSKYQLIVYSVLMTTLPRQFPGEDVTVLMKLFIHGRTRYQP
ncbi:hypothetical protein Ccrd_016144, partial [Cynara cardunculus var. scolymus]